MTSRSRKRGPWPKGAAELVRGDLEDRSSLERALEGVYGVFSVQNFYEGGLKEREGVRSCFAPIRSRRSGVLACDNALMTSIASSWEML